MDILSLAASSHAGAVASAAAQLAVSPTLWYVTRATAIASYVTLSLSVAVGIIQSIGRVARERLPWAVDEIHQVLATLTGALIAGHLLALAFDPYLPFSVLNLIAPINEPYKPLGVTFGVLALYCMVALLLTSWLRRRTSHTFWRGVHYFSFVAFALVTAHGWVAGSDAKEPWMLALYVGACCAVVFLVLMRLFTSPHGEAKPSL